MTLCGRDTSPSFPKMAGSPHPAHTCSAAVTSMDTILLPREKSIKDGASQASRKQSESYSLAMLHGPCTLVPTVVAGLPQQDLGNGLMY